MTKNTIVSTLKTVPIFLSVPGPVYVYIIPDRPDIRVWVVTELQTEKVDGRYGQVPRKISFYSTPSDNLYNPLEYKYLKEVYLYDGDMEHSGVPRYDDVERIKNEILQKLFPPIKNANETKRYFMETCNNPRNQPKIYVTSNTKNFIKELKQHFPGVADISTSRTPETRSLDLWEGHYDGLMGCGGLIEINAPTAFYLERTFKANLISL